MIEFMECETCFKKPGSPTLCSSCLHNRNVVNTLNKKLNEIGKITNNVLYLNDNSDYYSALWQILELSGIIEIEEDMSESDLKYIE